MASPLLNDWVPLVGDDPHSLSLEYTVATGLVRGEDYAFRYRAINQVGAGPWSDVAIIKAAGEPAAPARPTWVASSATSVTLAFYHDIVDNGGSQITSYKLKRDDGSSTAGSGAISVEVVEYDGASPSHEVTGLTAGLIYRFQYFATNIYGDSRGSDIVSFAATVLPDPPGSPTIDWALSGATSLMVNWTATSTGTLPEAAILGYLLQVDEGNATYVTVYNGTFKPGVLGHLVAGLESGHFYKFQII